MVISRIEKWFGLCGKEPESGHVYRENKRHGLHPDYESNERINGVWRIGRGFITPLPAVARNSRNPCGVYSTGPRAAGSGC